MTSTTTAKREIIGRECRFAIHVPSYHPDDYDLHVVKEQVTVREADGSIVQYPNLVFKTDYERPFWVTKKGHYRKHTQKKEYEHVDKLQMVSCTQSKLRNRVAASLEKEWSKDPMKQLLKSPYIYGADISSSSLLKHDYMKKWPDLTSPYSNCVYDVETDVVDGHEEVLMGTMFFKNELLISVDKRFLGGMENVEELFKAASKKYIGQYIDKLDLKITLHIAEDVVDCIRTLFNQVHKWKPDWLSIWNIKFDIPKTIAMLEKYGVDPKDVLCDPSVPKDKRICKFYAGQDKQTTASGKVKPINAAAQWHEFRCTASYMGIDAMCSYKHLRLGEQEEPSYSLDAILNKHLKINKLMIPEAEGKERLEYHVFMQKFFKIEYMVYNMFDCISMRLLDDEIKDLKSTMPSFSVTTDFAKFKSNPRKISDALHFFALERNHVMATVGASDKPNFQEVGNVDDDLEPLDDDDDDEEENTALEDYDEDGEPLNPPDMPSEKQTLNLKDWIITLRSHMSVLGLPIAEEDPTLATNFRGFAYDSDATAAYPSATVVGNVGRSTTKREIIGMKGVKESTFRFQNMNLLIGPVNAIEYCQVMFNMPKPQDLLLQFQRDMLQ